MRRASGTISLTGLLWNSTRPPEDTFLGYTDPRSRPTLGDGPRRSPWWAGNMPASRWQGRAKEKPQLGAGARGPLLGGHGEYAGGRTQINGLARPGVPYLSADGEENAAGTIPTARRCPLSSRCPRRREHRLRRRLPPRRMSAQHRRKSRRRLSPLWQQIPNVWPEVANPAPRSRRPTYGRQRGAVSPRRPRPAERSALPPLSM
jgi:hypothetical protein